MTDLDPVEPDADEPEGADPVSLVDAGARWIGPDQPVGPLAFGCWRFVGTDVTKARELIEVALDEGMDLIDTADIYGTGFGGAGVGASEELLGRVLAEAPELRDRMVLATKGGIVGGVPYDSSVEHLVTACEASLRRLGVDVIDLYQVHRPDLLTHPSEVAAALDALVGAGKIRSVGVSNHTPAQTEALDAHLEAAIDTTQPELSVACLAPLLDGTGDLAMRDGRTVLAYSPLARGSLASGEGLAPALLAVLDELAAREDVDRATLALAFVLAMPFRPVAILGTQDPARLRAAGAALDVFLDRTDVYRILGAAGVPLP
ncbi:MAG: putative oxidoreductase [Acidimicrobiales bacterium]|nr:putative oxidoreductase [Acidimicrobiales bacterium]